MQNYKIFSDPQHRLQPQSSHQNNFLKTQPYVHQTPSLVLQSDNLIKIPLTQNNQTSYKPLSQNNIIIKSNQYQMKNAQFIEQNNIQNNSINQRVSRVLQQPVRQMTPNIVKNNYTHQIITESEYLKLKQNNPKITLKYKQNNPLKLIPQKRILVNNQKSEDKVTFLKKCDKNTIEEEWNKFFDQLPNFEKQKLERMIQLTKKEQIYLFKKHTLINEAMKSSGNTINNENQNQNKMFHSVPPKKVQNSYFQEFNNNNQYQTSYQHPFQQIQSQNNLPQKIIQKVQSPEAINQIQQPQTNQQSQNVFQQQQNQIKQSISFAQDDSKLVTVNNIKQDFSFNNNDNSFINQTNDTFLIEKEELKKNEIQKLTKKNLKNLIKNVIQKTNEKQNFKIITQKPQLHQQNSDEIFQEVDTGRNKSIKIPDNIFKNENIKTNQENNSIQKNLNNNHNKNQDILLKNEMQSLANKYLKNLMKNVIQNTQEKLNIKLNTQTTQKPQLLKQNSDEIFKDIDTGRNKSIKIPDNIFKNEKIKVNQENIIKENHENSKTQNNTNNEDKEMQQISYKNTKNLLKNVLNSLQEQQYNPNLQKQEIQLNNFEEKKQDQVQTNKKPSIKPLNLKKDSLKDLFGLNEDDLSEKDKEEIRKEELYVQYSVHSNQNFFQDNMDEMEDMNQQKFPDPTKVQMNKKQSEEKITINENEKIIEQNKFNINLQTGNMLIEKIKSEIIKDDGTIVNKTMSKITETIEISDQNLKQEIQTTITKNDEDDFSIFPIGLEKEKTYRVNSVYENQKQLILEEILKEQTNKQNLIVQRKVTTNSLQNYYQENKDLAIQTLIIDKEGLNKEQREAKIKIFSDRYDEIDRVKNQFQNDDELLQIYDLLLDNLLLDIENEKKALNEQKECLFEYQRKYTERLQIPIQAEKQINEQI